MSEKRILNKVKALLGLEVKLEQMKLENGTVIEAESFEAGFEVFVVSDEDRIAVPIGEYVLEDGKILVVAEEGIIAEIKEKAEEVEPEAEAEVEVEAEQEVAPKKIVESITKEMFFEEIEKLRNEIAELKLAKEEVKEVELSEQVEPIKHSPEALVDEKPLNLYAQKRQKSTIDLIYQKLNNN